jgi:Domain of unknown function (DUF4383)
MATHSETRTLAGGRINSLVAGAVGAVFVVIGMLGFTVSDGHGAAGHTGGLLLGLFQVNVLHNVVHLAVGAAMIGTAVAGVRAAKAANTLIGVVYLALGLAGLFITGDNPANVIALNGADNGLHLATGAALIAIGLRADRE